MASSPVSVEIFSDILCKKDYHLRIWKNWADFQLKMKSGGTIARSVTGEDILHDIIDGVLSGRVNWDHIRVPNVNTFMHNQVRSFVSNLIKKEKENTIVLDYDIKAESLSEILEKQDKEEIENLVLQHLENDVTGYFVFLQTISGWQNFQIAKELGLTLAEVECAKKRIRTIVRAMQDSL